jgi:tripartite-type tricarboxylate transporter receptor subunit TctC
MRRRGMLARARLLGTAFAVLAGLTVAEARAEWPERAVSIIVPAGAGGGTDATGRMLSKQLQEILGKPFNIINNGEGGGAVGHTMITTARPDGYTLGIVFPFAQTRLMGQTDVTAAKFAPIAQYNFDPAALQVSESSPFKTGAEALAAFKAEPAKYKVNCGGGCASSWDLPMVGMLLEAGIDGTKIVRIPSRGAAAGLQELAAGGVDFIAASLPEAGPLIEAGKVRPLFVLSEKRNPAFPNVPTSGEVTGKPFEGGAFRGLVAPAGTPEAIIVKLEQAMKKIYESAEFQDQMNARGFGLRWRDRAEFTSFLQQHEIDTKRVMTELGLVKS